MARISRCFQLLSILNICILVFGCDRVRDGLLRLKREIYHTSSNTDTTPKTDTTSEADIPFPENDETNVGISYCGGKQYDNHILYCKDGKIRKCRRICGGMKIAYCKEQCSFFYNCRWQPIGVEDPAECQKYFPSYRKNILKPGSANGGKNDGPNDDPNDGKNDDQNDGKNDDKNDDPNDGKNDDPNDGKNDDQNDGPKSTETKTKKEIKPADGTNAAEKNTTEKPTDNNQGILTEKEKPGDDKYTKGLLIAIIVLLVVLILVVSVGFIGIYLYLRRRQTASPEPHVDVAVADDAQLAQLVPNREDPNRRFWRIPSEIDHDENVEDETSQFIIGGKKDHGSRKGEDPNVIIDVERGAAVIRSHDATQISSETETVNVSLIRRRPSLPQSGRGSKSLGSPSIIKEEKGLLEPNYDSGDEVFCPE